MDLSVRSRLDRHIVAAQAALFQTMAGSIFEQTPDWVRAYSGLRWPNFNIFLPLTSTGLSDDTLADTAAFFMDRQVFYSVELVHDRFPEGPDFLDQRGYQALPPQPAMALHDMPADIRLNPAVEVERVRTVPSLTAFCTLLHRVFDFPLADMVKLAPVNHLKSDVIYHYLAFLDEQPVSAGTLVCVQGVASVWNMCTIDEYRQRGVATTLLHRMLTDSQAKGGRHMMLYSTAQAYHLFNKFGFEIFTQRQWFLPPGIDYGDE
ncbi:MAG: GNAT family N-acetyltransferase [Chloroflexota bacterium]